MTWVAIRISAKEQKLKVKYGINYLEGEVLLEGRALIVVVSIGFFGGLSRGSRPGRRIHLQSGPFKLGRPP